jgi:uncharacterized repeat protein (TIGR01451 family)
MKRYRLSGQTMLVAACVAVVFAFAIAASAQTVSPTPTTVTLWGGTQDFSAFGLSSLTTPSSGVILQGTAISGFTGKPVRHMWYGDGSNGLCRVDPEMDDPGVSSIPGIGYRNNVEKTCIATIQKTAFVPGQIAYDAATNTMYATNIGRTNSGIVRMHYIPSGDNGQGTVDPIHVEVLMGTQTGRNAAGGCPQVGDPVLAGNPLPVQPDVANLGPDGNLYIGFKRGGSIIRILSPATFNPNSTDCTTKIQVPLFSADERVGNGHTFGLGWIGHDLFGGDNIAPWILPSADQCMTPVNGNVRCSPTAATEILAAFIPGPQGGLISDAQFPTFQGNTLYAATLSSITRIINVATVAGMTMSPNFGGPFCNITGLTLDPNDLANETLYVGADCTAGGINGAGSIWQVKAQALLPGPPAPPTTVTAVGGPASATVSWVPTPNGQSVTGYNVQKLVGGVASGAVVVVNAPAGSAAPTSVTITGLTNGTTYTFKVEAFNANGTSAFSAPSNAVTPLVLSAPSAPLGASAVAGNASANVAWSAPTNTGGTPITSYTVTARVGGVATAIKATVPGTSTGANVIGLTNGTSYTFTVHATNSVGNGPESAASNAVSPVVANLADMAVTMSVLPNVNAGSILTYTLTVTNNGPANVTRVSLTDTLPGAFSSSTTTQGACSAAGAAFSCNLGGMTAGTSATVTVSVLIGNTNVTNTATVAGFDSTGAAMSDPTPGNNSATAATLINQPGSGGGAGVSADLQVNGSAQNGGPSVGSADTYTWQIKNSTGNTTAPGVVFTLTLPPSLQFLSATPGQGTCSGVTIGSFGGTLTCSLGSIGGGGQALVTVNFTPLQAGSVSALGSVTFSGTDTNVSNNSFSVTINPK